MAWSNQDEARKQIGNTSSACSICGENYVERWRHFDAFQETENSLITIRCGDRSQADKDLWAQNHPGGRYVWLAEWADAGRMFEKHGGKFVGYEGEWKSSWTGLVRLVGLSSAGQLMYLVPKDFPTTGARVGNCSGDRFIAGISTEEQVLAMEILKWDFSRVESRDQEPATIPVKTKKAEEPAEVKGPMTTTQWMAYLGFSNVEDFRRAIRRDE